MHDLNSSQQAAVSYRQGHLLIVAGPGTGKTHTLTHRISSFIPQLKTNQKILAITFTNKAAFELKERLTILIPDILDKAVMGTFHSFCLMILEKYWREAGLKEGFIVADSNEIARMSETIWAGRKASECRQLLQSVSLWKATSFNQVPSLEIKTYNHFLQSKNWLDFDDLILETIKLLQASPSVRAQIHVQYPFLFVDEYQDINFAQHALLKLLVGEKSHITAIGDPNQAIYGFRGANVKFLDSFLHDYPGTTALSLSDNYRSAQNILEASSQIMAKAQRSAVPELIARIMDQGQLVIHQAPSERFEAVYIVKEIEKMIGGMDLLSSARQNDKNYSFRDFAILYRLNTQRLTLEKTLRQSGIPFQVFGLKPAQESQEDCSIPDFRYPQNHQNEEKVSLMTLHASKGLEFPVVFILGCEEGLMPLNLPDLQSDPAEERRLFYVGMTRAKSKLYLLHSRKRILFGKTYGEPSPFLKDIEERLKEYEQIKISQRRKKDEQMSLF